VRNVGCENTLFAAMSAQDYRIKGDVLRFVKNNPTFAKGAQM